MNRKTIVILMLLVAAMLFAGCQVTMLSPDDPEDAAKAVAKQAEADTVERIRTMKIVQEETLLIRDILLLKSEVAKIQAANAPPAQSKPARQKVEVPELGVEGEFIPLAELPANMQ